MPLKDPVCNMKVDESSKFSVLHEDTSYYFCSQTCYDKFINDPKKYIEPHDADHECCNTTTSAETKKEPDNSKAGKYTCPMHPEVESDKPGDCPKCGMALESLTPTAAAEKTEYTCPMHPEIVQDEPGSCPLC